MDSLKCSELFRNVIISDGDLLVIQQCLAGLAQMGFHLVVVVGARGCIVLVAKRLGNFLKFNTLGPSHVIHNTISPTIIHQ